jgi:hypothetical protein
MAAKLTRLTHKIAIQLHLVAKSRIICGYRSRRPVRKLLDTLSYIKTKEKHDEKSILCDTFMNQHTQLEIGYI